MDDTRGQPVEQEADHSTINRNIMQSLERLNERIDNAYYDSVELGAKRKGSMKLTTGTM